MLGYVLALLKRFQTDRFWKWGNAGVVHDTTHPICTSPMLGKAASQ